MRSTCSPRAAKQRNEAYTVQGRLYEGSLTSELTGTHRPGAASRMLPRTACGALPVRVRVERPVRLHLLRSPRPLKSLRKEVDEPDDFKRNDGVVGK